MKHGYEHMSANILKRVEWYITSFSHVKGSIISVKYDSKLTNHTLLVSCDAI